jgi:hypothetical protein
MEAVNQGFPFKSLSVSLDGSRNNHVRKLSRQLQCVIQGMSRSLNFEVKCDGTKRRGMTLLDEKDDQKLTQVSSSIRSNTINISNSAYVAGTPRVECVTLLDRTTGASTINNVGTKKPTIQLQQASSNNKQDDNANKAKINDSMRLLLESMKRSAISRSIIKRFPSPFSVTLQPSSSKDNASTKKNFVVKAKRKMSQHKTRKNTAARLTTSADISRHRREHHARILPLHVTKSTITNNNHPFPTEITVITPPDTTIDSSSTGTLPVISSSILFEDSAVMGSSSHAHSISGYCLDDDLSLESSIIFDDMASITPSLSWLWRDVVHNK